MWGLFLSLGAADPFKATRVTAGSQVSCPVPSLFWKQPVGVGGG